MLRKVLIVGCFDPIHEGHLDHIRKAGFIATQTAAELIIVTHKDHKIVEKKGYCFMRLEVREFLLRSVLSYLGIKGKVITALEDDLEGKHYKDGIGDTIRKIKPVVFAKGGDRTPDNMPPDEIASCSEIGCQILYGVGDLLNSSSEIVKKANV